MSSFGLLKRVSSCSPIYKRSVTSILHRVQSMSVHTSSLVSTEWLYHHLQQSHIKVLDGSWYLPILKRQTFQEYQQQRIPGAQFFDIDKVADLDTDLPHMLPNAQEFSHHMSQMGLENTDHIVIYDTIGVASACRVYWTLRVFGHKDVSVLDGGLLKWLQEQRPIQSGPSVQVEKPSVYKSDFQPHLVKSYAEMVQIVKDQSHVVVDARPSPRQVYRFLFMLRFKGEAPEPRPGIPSGHMPGAKNVPFLDVVDPVTKTLLPKEKLAALFKQQGVDVDSDTPIVNSCGSGVTAAVTYFALEQAGAKGPLSLYDGSWAEYARDPNSNIASRGPISH